MTRNQKLMTGYIIMAATISIAAGICIYAMPNGSMKAAVITALLFASGFVGLGFMANA